MYVYDITNYGKIHNTVLYDIAVYCVCLRDISSLYYIMCCINLYQITSNYVLLSYNIVDIYSNITCLFKYNIAFYNFTVYYIVLN